MSYQGRYNSGSQAPKRGRGSGTWKIVVLTVVITVIATLLLEVGGAWLFLNSKLGKFTQAKFEEKDTSDMDLSALIGNLDETEPTPTVSQWPEETTPEAVTEAPTEAPTEAATEPDYGKTGKIVNILVVGQDSRAGEESKLADGIMLLTLNKETHTLAMTSFLRDSYVKLADYAGHTCGKNRINTAYALGYAWRGDAGAMEMLNLTIANNYGVNVDGNVEISFDTFKTIVDALGGVDIDLQGDEYTKMCEYRDMYNEHYEWNKMDKHINELVEGVNTLNGDMALEYARERHVNNSDSDMNRVVRQQKVLTQVIDKAAKMSPLELNKLIDVVLSEIITNISTDDMRTYITELTPYLVGLKLTSHQCPAEGTYWGEMVDLPDGPGGVLKIDFEKNKQIMAAIVNGEEVE